MPSIDFRRTYPGARHSLLSAWRKLRGVSRCRSCRTRDFVIIHEWNDPEVVNAILQRKQQMGFLALLHDTHHRAYTSAHEILKFHLHRFDGVLAFGEAIRKIYRDGFGIARTWTFHEAADVSVFQAANRRQSDRRGLDRQLGRRRTHERADGVPGRTGARASANAQSSLTAFAIRRQAREAVAPGRRPLSRVSAEPGDARRFTAKAALPCMCRGGSMPTA